MQIVFFFPRMFRTHIKDSNLKIPEDFDNFDPVEYPHFQVFLNVHLGRPIIVECLEDNANIIADIDEKDLMEGNVTYQDLFDKGVILGDGTYIV